MDQLKTRGQKAFFFCVKTLTVDSIAKLIALHDNYVVSVDVPEDDTQQEQAEVRAFLDTVLATPIMELTAAFMAQHGFIPANNFRETLLRL